MEKPKPNLYYFSIGNNNSTTFKNILTAEINRLFRTEISACVFLLETKEFIFTENQWITNLNYLSD